MPEMLKIAEVAYENLRMKKVAVSDSIKNKLYRKTLDNVLGLSEKALYESSSGGMGITGLKNLQRLKRMSFGSTLNSVKGNPEGLYHSGSKLPVVFDNPTVRHSLYDIAERTAVRNGFDPRYVVKK